MAKTSFYSGSGADSNDVSALENLKNQAQTSATAAASSATAAASSASSAAASVASLNEDVATQSTKGLMSAADKTKLDGVETNADVTDATNVTAAGALMDSEVTSLSGIKTLTVPDSTTVSTFGASLIDDADAAAARTTLGLGTAATTASTAYATAAQGTTADAALPKAGGTMTGEITFASGQTFDGRDVSVDGTKLDTVETNADVTDATNVQAAGALMDSELTSEASVKAINQGVATTDSPTFAALDVTGTVTADGLTVDGTGVEVVSVNSTQNGAQINFDSASTSVDWSVGISNSADGDFLIYQSGSGSGDILLYTGGAKRQEINRNGDISFYEDTGTTAKFFWDASAESLAIGTTSPNQPLTVVTNSSAQGINLAGRSSDNRAYMFFSDNNGTTYRGSIHTIPADNRFNINAYSGENITFSNNGVEKVRIDSSGNLLVGTTSFANTTEGLRLKADFSIAGARDGAGILYLNRLTSDGDIINLQRDGSQIGGIGVTGYDLYVGTTDTGLRFVNSTDSIEPVNISTQARRDASIDFGSSGYRFKDLYLSGGVFLGGTGSANKLDDYEEGTWTPTYEAQTGSFTTMTYSNNTGTYTKVGRLVTVQLNISTSNVDLTGASGFLKVGNLPFTVSTANHAGAVSGMYRWNLASDRTAPIQISTISGQTYCVMYKNNMNSSTSDSIQVTDLTTGASTFRNALIATISYIT